VEFGVGNEGSNAGLSDLDRIRELYPGLETLYPRLHDLFLLQVGRIHSSVPIPLWSGPCRSHSPANRLQQ
jgi:hypothetical protein